MTRGQIEADITVIKRLIAEAKSREWPTGDIQTLDRAIAHLRTRLARLDGPPPGHVRARIAFDVDSIGTVRARQGRPGKGERRSWGTLDLPLPEPAAEVEGEVE